MLVPVVHCSVNSAKLHPTKTISYLTVIIVLGNARDIGLQDTKGIRSSHTLFLAQFVQFPFSCFLLSVRFLLFSPLVKGCGSCCYSLVLMASDDHRKRTSHVFYLQFAHWRGSAVSFCIRAETVPGLCGWHFLGTFLGTCSYKTHRERISCNIS